MSLLIPSGKLYYPLSEGGDPSSATTVSEWKKRAEVIAAATCIALLSLGMMRFGFTILAYGLTKWSVPITNPENSLLIISGLTLAYLGDTISIVAANLIYTTAGQTINDEIERRFHRMAPGSLKDRKAEAF